MQDHEYNYLPTCLADGQQAYEEHMLAVGKQLASAILCWCAVVQSEILGRRQRSFKVCTAHNTKRHNRLSVQVCGYIMINIYMRDVFIVLSPGGLDSLSVA